MSNNPDPKKRLKGAMQDVFDAKENKPQLYTGLMGNWLANGEAVTEVAGRPGYVWVRLRGDPSEAVVAFNDQVANHFDLPVLIRRDDKMPNKWIVLGRDITQYPDWGSASPYLAQHGDDHSFTAIGDYGNDLVWVYKRQFMPLLPQPDPSGTLSLFLNAGHYYANQEYHWWPGSGTKTLEEFYPTGGNRGRFVTVSIDPATEMLSYDAGDEFDPYTNKDYTSEIVLPSGKDFIPVVAGFLTTGSTILGWGDIFDLRLTPVPPSDSAIGGPSGTFLGDLADVSVTTPRDLSMLQYNTQSGSWRNDDIRALLFDIGATGTPEVGGMVNWNGNEFTINVITGLGPVLQVGQEIYIFIFNDTGSVINNLEVLRPLSATAVGDIVVPTVELAQADIFSRAEGTLMVATMDIPVDSVGLATRFGRARGGDTSAFTPGNALFLSATTPGGLTETAPVLPNYSISIGGVVISDASVGEIFVSVTRDIFSTLDFWNGTFRETFDFSIISDGVAVTGSLLPANSHDDMTMVFSDGYSLLDTNPAATVALTPGTDENPQINFVYIPKSTKVLTASTSDWPVNEEHIKVAKIVLQSAATTQTTGALGNQNWNDHIADTITLQGHLSHIAERIRQNNAEWDSGAEGAADIAGGGSDAYVRNTAGVIYQLHRQDFPLLDTTPYTIDDVIIASGTFTISDDGDLSSTFPDGRMISVYDSTGNDGMYTINNTLYSDPDFVITVEEAIPDATVDGVIGDDIHVVNDFSTAYSAVNSLTEISTDASGVSLNNTSFSVVVWGVMNRSGQPSHLMANFPTDTYNKNFPEQAVSDALNNSVYNIPKIFKGIGFLIARFTFVNSGGSWSLYETEDLRGFTPNTAAGGGGGGGGVSTFTGLTDTPNAYTSAALQIAQVNAGETALEFTDFPTFAGLLIDGNADEIQLIVQAHSTQTANIFEVQKSDGTQYVVVDGAGQVGIGTDSPSHTLNVVGGSAAVPTLKLSGAFAMAAGARLYLDQGSDTYFQEATSNRVVLRTAGVVRQTWHENSNVGIGNFATPLARLHVVGNADDEVLIVQANATQTTNVLEIQNSSSVVLVSFAGFDSISAFAINQADTTNVFTVDTTNGRVGIGTANPDALLHLTGDLYLDDGVGVSPTLRFVDGADDNLRMNFTTSVFTRLAFTTNGRLTEVYDIRDKDGVGANNNFLEQLIKLETDGGGIPSIGSQTWRLNDATEGSASSSWAIKTAISGTFQERLYIDKFGNIQIGQIDLSPTALLHIVGRNDDQQLIIEAHSTQTENILEIQDSSNNIQLAIAGNGRDFILDTTTGTKIGTATNQKLGFYNATPIVQPTEITDELTTITFTAPGTPDYAIQDLTDSSPFGFVTKDEGNTVLSVIANLQARVNELESVLSSLGLLADAD